MNYWMLLIMKVILFHGICYLIYWVALRKVNLFSLNRIYLLTTLILGFVAPLVLLPSPFPAIDPGFIEAQVIAGTFSDEVSTSSAAAPRVTSGSPYLIILIVIYCFGVTIFLFRSIKGLLFVRKIKRCGVGISSSPKVVAIRNEFSFAFMDTIFLSETASPVVLLHETGHINEKHWVDLILLEIICVVCWLNPFVWLYRRSLRQQHEYLADNYVLQCGILPEDYLRCIIDSLSTHEPIGTIHNFNSQSLKQRILMMTKNRISPYTQYFYFALVPFLFALFFAFTITEDDASSVPSEKIFVIDAAHGGSDIGSVSASGVTEKEIALSLAKLVMEIGVAQGLHIHMTRKTDVQLSLADRVKFSADMNADAFLSIHAGFDTQGVEKGLEVVVSDANIKFAESKRFATFLTGELDDVSEFSNPVVRSSGAYVLKHNHAPGVIVEAGYLSNEKNVEFISDPANQRIVATQIVSALMKY